MKTASDAVIMLLSTVACRGERRAWRGNVSCDLIGQQVRTTLLSTSSDARFMDCISQYDEQDALMDSSECGMAHAVYSNE